MESYLIYETNLTGEYKKSFQLISAYLNAEYVDEVTVSNYLTELLDSFLAAQDEGRPVESIVGKDIESFCRNFCADFTYKERLYKIWDFMKELVWCVLFLSLMDMLVEDATLFTAQSSPNIFGYLAGALLIAEIYEILYAGFTHAMFQHGKINIKICNVVSLFLLVLIIVCYICLVSGKIFHVVLTVPAFVPAAAAICFLAVYYAANRKRRKAHKENKVSLWKSATQETALNIDEQMEKKRLKKKMEPEAFLQKEMRETEKMAIAGKFEWIVFVLAAVAILAAEMPAMETFVDGAVFVLIIAVIDFIVYRAEHNFFDGIVVTRRKWAENYKVKIEGRE